MEKTVAFVLGLLFSFNCLSQNRSNWTPLDYLNQDPEYTFQTEKNIEGLCFITLSDSFNYYLTPIIIKDKGNKQIIRIEFIDSLGILTTYRGDRFKSYDVLNPFNPWLWVDNPDYFRLAFECIDSTGNFYKVQLNETELAWIKKTDKNFKKEAINDFVLKWTTEPMGLDFNRVTNPLRKEPKVSSEEVKNAEQGKYQIWKAVSLEMHGDWIKVRTIKDEVGWIRWRDGNKVLIRMYYAC